MADYEVRLKSQTKPKFMHNAKQSGKLPTWTYEYWDKTNKNKKATFDITMTRKMYGDENSQSKQMNDAAMALIKKNYKGAKVKLVR